LKLAEITSELLAQAVTIYLPVAYPGGGWSQVVGERARLPAGRRGAELLADERFERVPPQAPLEQAARFNLRLGNAVYPNMKLGLDRVSQTDEFVLVVDTHDKLLASAIQEGEREKYRALLEHNRRVQEEVERAWTAAGLPTFERYLRCRMTQMAARRAAQHGAPE